MMEGTLPMNTQGSSLGKSVSPIIVVAAILTVYAVPAGAQNPAPNSAAQSDSDSVHPQTPNAGNTQTHAVSLNSIISGLPPPPSAIQVDPCKSKDPPSYC
jgi:hypothetical protein